ncbi:LutC/YkgG family protein [Ferrimonas marina]|uniref:L-lactate dehydrogenase complex protein LldG n=1 Tax=Ferrimonas marina TaxID=299255 RepID=A0A1M5RVJ7_9GAMM|nr:LUD domain-containing protein [Ferrimonas marina]SHH30210.1 L-lactate dehydrogenase complex protein LldG [Ferrimonas marina]
MSSRAAILANLAELNLPNQPMPEILAPELEGDLAELLAASVEKVGGQLIPVTSTDAIQAYLDAKVENGEQVMSLVDGLNGNRPLDDSPHALRNVDHTLIRADFAVAENGAVFIEQGAMGHRAAPYITEHLAVVVKAGDIFATMHQAVPAIDMARGEHGVFIAGPSKTADIEQALVIGAHGASSMTVFLLG